MLMCTTSHYKTPIDKPRADCALGRQHGVILVKLDLSAAFDTIDHDILAKRLHDRFGIRSKVYDWLNSFMRGRTQRVSLGSLLSRRQTLQFGVPQGLVQKFLYFIIC